jgi:hypothetical protein
MRSARRVIGGDAQARVAQEDVAGWEGIAVQSGAGVSRIGDHARALDNLEKAYDADSQLLAWLGQDAMFDSLRSEPRFVELLRKLHFVK